MGKQIIDQIAEYAHQHGHTETAIAEWQATWTTCLRGQQVEGLCGQYHLLPYQIPADWADSTVYALPNLGQTFVDKGETCPECGGWATSTDVIMPVWQAIATQLGHLWATQSMIEWTPQNLTEVAYLQNSLRRFGDWGYNPPLKYSYFNNNKLVHATKKQEFLVACDRIEWSLTTTRNFPVASATIREPYYREFPEGGTWWVMDITSIITRPLQGRADRLQWLVDWADMVRSMNGKVMCRQLEITAETLEEWAAIAPILEDRLLKEGDWFIQE